MITNKLYISDLCCKCSGLGVGKPWSMVYIQLTA